MTVARQVVNVIELFAGAGGLGIGFLLADHERVRYQPIISIDADKNAIDSYRYNMRWLATNASQALPIMPRIYQKKVERLTARSVFRAFKMQKGDLDLLIGGPPCQGYSPANRQTSSGRKKDLNNMTKVFMDKVEEFMPKMFVIENVQGVQWTSPTEEMQFGSTQLPLFVDEKPLRSDVRDYIISRATSLKYKIWHGIMDASNYGVPQRRMRFFFVGVREDIAKDNPIDLSEFLAKKRVQTPNTVNLAIGDLPELENGQKWSGGDYSPNQNNYISFLRQYMVDGALYDHYTTQHQPYVIERFKLIPEGKNWSAIKAMMTTYKDVDRTHSNIYRRLIGDAPAHTVSHYRKSMTIHPKQHRGLSFREACRLQSFPDWCRFSGGADSSQQQLANAVPPLLASTVAWAVAELWSQLGSQIVTSNSYEQNSLFSSVESVALPEVVTIESNTPASVS